jgi:hypothetical protein
MPGKIIRQRFHCNEVPRCASARLWVGFLTALALRLRRFIKARSSANHCEGGGLLLGDDPALCSYQWDEP